MTSSGRAAWDRSSEKMSKTADDFDLDPRLLRALKKIEFVQLMPIQEKVISFAQEGKDVMAKARTGSGKTAAYCIPVIDKILKAETQGRYESGLKALILVPSKELAAQVYDFMQKLTLFSAKTISVANLMVSDSVTSYSSADIIVCTPSRAVKFLEKNSSKLSLFESLVIDEADLVLSFGYENDIKKLIGLLPNTYQAFLLSATLSVEIDELKNNLLRNYVVVKMEDDSEASSNALSQYSVSCKTEDKCLLLYFILKLRLVKGKAIIFVKDIENCYRIKLFLDQFSIKSCVLNSELPFNSRYHVVQQFNQGIYDYIIATDECEKHAKQKTNESSTGGETEKIVGVSRGVDFRDAQAIINFDFPLTTRSYVHRVGRTARGMNSGTAISFLTDSDKRIFAKVSHKQQSLGNAIKPFSFDMDQVNNFRYRCEDALRVITKSVIKEARMKDLKREIMSCDRLKSHFDEHTVDFALLKHDKPILPTQVKAHLKHVPDYLLPKGMKSTTSTNSSTSQRQHKAKFYKSRNNYKKKTRNPLKTLSIDK